MKPFKNFINPPDNNLRKLRNAKEMTQSKLCIELRKYNCYISRSAYAKYETNSRQIPINTLIQLAYCFNTSTDYILGITDNPSPK